MEIASKSIFKKWLVCGFAGVFNVTFNNSSVASSRSVLLAKEIGVLRKNISQNVVSSTPRYQW